MKRLISIALVLSTLFLFSCTVNENNNDVSKNKKQEDETQDQDKIVIYFEGSETRSFIEAVIADNESKEVNATLMSVSKLSFDIDNESDIDKATTTPDTMKFSIQGKEYEVDYESTHRTLVANSDKKHLKEISDFVSYKSDDLRVEYRESTGEILKFMRSDVSKSFKEEEFLAENEIADIAQKYLNELYGEEYMKDYVMSSCTWDSKTVSYILRFWKYVGGVKTNSYVAMHICPDGTIKSMTFKNKGVYDNAANEVSQEMIDKAYKYMTDLFNEAGLQAVLDPDVLMSTVGDYYLCVNVSNGSNTLDRYYVNLNQFK